jgi:addiction module HigA family antidote
MATKLRVSPSTLNRVLTATSSVTPEMALRLSRCLGRSAENWLAMQHSYDLWQAKRSVDLRGIETLKVGAA